MWRSEYGMVRPGRIVSFAEVDFAQERELTVKWYVFAKRDQIDLTVVLFDIFSRFNENGAIEYLVVLRFVDRGASEQRDL